MSEKCIVTVVINVFDEKCCDVYFFTPEHKKWCADLMNKKTFTSFVKESMHYPLFNTKQDNQNIDIKDLVRRNLDNHFARIKSMNIHSYLDFSQSYSLEPEFDTDDSVLDEVYVCDYRIDSNLYSCSETSSWFYRVPKLCRANEFVCDDDCTFHLHQEELEDVIYTVERCGDELETFADLSLYAVKDDRGIVVCPFSVGNRDYFVQKAREHASGKNYLMHRTYVYEYRNGKTSKIYGCCKFDEISNVVALELGKEDDCSDNSSVRCCLDNINKRLDAFSVGRFDFTVDDAEVLSSYCTKVFASYQEGKIIIKARFYFNKDTRNVSTSDSFSIGSKHRLCLKVSSRDLREQEELLSLDSSILIERSFGFDIKELDAPLEFELVFESE